MSEIKGRFIMLVAALVGLYPDKQKEADDYLMKKTGKTWKALDPEGWYDMAIFRASVKISGHSVLSILGTSSSIKFFSGSLIIFPFIPLPRAGKAKEADAPIPAAVFKNSLRFIEKHLILVMFATYCGHNTLFTL